MVLVFADYCFCKVKLNYNSLSRLTIHSAVASVINAATCSLFESSSASDNSVVVFIRIWLAIYSKASLYPFKRSNFDLHCKIMAVFCFKSTFNFWFFWNYLSHFEVQSFMILDYSCFEKVKLFLLFVNSFNFCFISLVFSFHSLNSFNSIVLLLLLGILCCSMYCLWSRSIAAVC